MSLRHYKYPNAKLILTIIDNGHFYKLCYIQMYFIDKYHSNVSCTSSKKYLIKDNFQTSFYRRHFTEDSFKMFGKVLKMSLLRLISKDIYLWLLFDL